MMSTMRPRWAGVSDLSAMRLPSVGSTDGGCNSQTRSATLLFHCGKFLVEIGQDHVAASLVEWPTAMPTASR